MTITEKDLAIGQEYKSLTSSYHYKITRLDTNTIYYDTTPLGQQSYPNSYSIKDWVRIVNNGTIVLISPASAPATQKPEEIEFKVGQIWREIAKANNTDWAEGSYKEYKLAFIKDNDLFFEPTGNISQDRKDKKQTYTARSWSKNYFIQGINYKLDKEHMWYFELIGQSSQNDAPTKSKPILIKCPSCGTQDERNYLGFFTVECVNSKCVHSKKN